MIDSRLAEDGSQVRRRRECLECEERFSTREISNLQMPRVIKRDGRRTAFNEDKLRRGMLKALEKRPVAISEVDRSVQRVIHGIQVQGERKLKLPF